MLKKFASLAKFSRPALETAFKPARTFCINAAYLDPGSHITMSHNPHNVYEDLVMVGDVLLPTREMKKVVSQKYVPDLLKIAFEVLNKHNPQAEISVENYEDIKYLSWKRFGVDIEAVKLEIIDRWSQEIFVSEHKFRYPIEQKHRLIFTSSIYSSLEFDRYRIALFFELYNGWLHMDIDRSHLFVSPKVKGDTSFLEKYLEDQGDEPTGVDVLQKNTPENKTVINRFLNYIHS